MKPLYYFTTEGRVRENILLRFHNSALVKKLRARTIQDLKPVYDNKGAWVEGSDVVGRKFFIKAPTIRMCFYKPEEVAVAHVLDEDMELLDKLLTAANKCKPPCRYCGGNCHNDERYSCDGYAGDIDGLYKRG